MSKYLLVIILSVFSWHSLSSQASQDGGLIIDLESIDNDSKREEIQRYFGYENLVYRYLTIPYDTSVNSNQRGRYIDIGYAIFSILPLILLGLFYKRKRLFYATAFGLLCYVSICFSFSFISSQSRGQAFRLDDAWDIYLTEDSKPLGEEMLAQVYNLTGFIAKPFISLADAISGDVDHITYPLLIFLFLISLWGIHRSKSLSSKIKILGTLYFTFGFLWLLLSGGIIWYGFLLFPLSYGLIVHYISNQKFKNYNAYSFIHGALLFVLLSWGLSSYVGRISNITYTQNASTNEFGKAVVDHNIFTYSTGLINSHEAKQKAYRNIGRTLDEINSNDAYIFQFGTSFAFEIRDNPNRIYLDAQLVQFFPLLETIKEKEKIIDIYKAGGVRYMIVDLLTHTLDHTPEQSLANKFKLLLNTLYKNPKVRLMATDRIIEIKTSDGGNRREYKVFGENIIDFGSYAIYELI